MDRRHIDRASRNSNRQGTLTSAVEKPWMQVPASKGRGRALQAKKFTVASGLCSLRAWEQELRRAHVVTGLLCYLPLHVPVLSVM